MQQHEKQHQNQPNLPQQKSSVHFYSVLLIILAALAAIYFYLMPFLSSTSGGGESSFDAHREALNLAIIVQNYRKNHRSIGRNLGIGEIVVIDQDGKSTSYLSPIYEGEKASAAYDPNENHSERRTHDLFLLPELKRLQDNGTLDKAQQVSILVFSQVFVCSPCRADMRGWWKDFRKAVSSRNAVKIQEPTIWELTGSYNPDRSGWPQWTVVATEEDVEPVPIPFDN